MPILRPFALALLLPAAPRTAPQFPPPAVDVAAKRTAPAWLEPYRDATGRLLGEAMAPTPPGSASPTSATPTAIA